MEKIIEEIENGNLVIMPTDTVYGIMADNDNLSDSLTCGEKTIGIRMLNNKLLLDIMNKINKPLISTSANISSKEVITNVNLIEDDLKEHISYILDDGEKTNISSTIVKVENNKIQILREGILANKIREDFKSYI